MDFEQIKENLLHALSELMALRLIVTSPREKVADLPALYAILAVCLSPGAVMVVILLGLITRHAIRFEKDAIKK